jgi:hypothetical protein
MDLHANEMLAKPGLPNSRPETDGKCKLSS